ncbi:MAG TPA: alpha/beta hydrolase [Acidimicrobiales bacterium]|nr:alpha/beta hydrolase [Acidimicrobiales bacterium]
MSYPADLHVLSRPGPRGAPTVVFVHGSLDRGESFRRVMRRLPEFGSVAYDRRGYQRSRDAGVTDLPGHAEDLLAIAATVRLDSGPDTTVVAVGHSFGGDVVVDAALASPDAFDAIGAFEPPMPWLGFRRDDTGAPRTWQPMADDPGEEAERFFGRMVGESAWARLTEQAKASRRADGPALMADMRSFRTEGPPFDVAALRVPAVFGMGGLASRPHHRRGVEWLGANVPGAVAYEIDGAQHGAHLSHPDHFAAFTRLVIERAADARS